MSTGLRERKKEARRCQLIAVARRLVLARGLDQVTVGEMCEEVGVSERTFFNYFGTKEDAVLGLGVDADVLSSQEIAAFVAGQPSGDLLRDGAHLVARILQRAESGLGERRAFFELVQREPKLLVRHVGWVELQRSRLVEMIAAREERLPTGVEPAITSAVLIALLHAMGTRWLESDRSATIEDCLPEVLAGFRRLATSPPATPATPAMPITKGVPT